MTASAPSSAEAITADRDGGALGTSRRAGSRVAEAWRQAWHAPAAPVGVVAVRVILSVQALWMLLSRPDLAELRAWPDVFWSSIDPLLRLRFGAGFLPIAVERVLFGLAHLSVVAALAGVAARWSCGLAGLLLYHFAPFEELASGVPHTFFGGLTLPCLGLLILAFAGFPDRNAAASPEWRWPLTLIRLLFTFNYFFAFLAKLRYSGLFWFSGANIERWLVENAAYTDAPWTQAVAGSPVLCWAVALATLVLEMGAPLAVLTPRLGKIFALAAFAFHAGIAQTLGIYFTSVPLLLLFLNWERPTPKARA